MADRTISPVSDIFLIWTAVIASLTAQLILALLGLGAGILAVDGATADAGTIGWAGFLWWAASGVLAAGIGGMTIAALGEGIDDGRKTLLALIAWATAILIVAIVAAIAGSGTSLFSAVGGPVPGMLEGLPEGQITDEVRRSLAAIAVSSVVAMLIGAAAQVAGAVYAPETNVRTKRA